MDSFASLAAETPPSATSAQRLADRLEIAGAHITIDRDAALEPVKEDLRAWIVSAATTVAAYYERFPTRDLTLRLAARRGGGIRGGTTTNFSGAVVSVQVGVGVTREELRSDWVLVHEMVHLALPEVGRRHNWLSEGLATYVEGIARAQSGTRSADDVWAEFRRSMPKGLPRRGEGGLDETHTWARTYWGGALFCLLADVAIREQTHNRASLREALTGVLRATGGYAGPTAPRGVPIEDVLRLGDAATRTTVLSDLYDRMKQAPAAPDLDELWARLGIRGDGNGTRFDATAPLAAVRAAMTARRDVVAD